MDAQPPTEAHSFDVDDFLDLFNWIDRIGDRVLGRLVHFDRSEPWIPALAASLSGADEWTFCVRRNAGFTGGDCDRLLNKYHIPLWSRRVTGRRFIFSVPKRQANWAEYLMLRRGMVLEGNLFNPDNQRYCRNWAPGTLPPAWDDREDPNPGAPITDS